MPSPLTTYLADHDAPCPSCDYNLKGVTTASCPECGIPLTLGVTSPPRQRAIKRLCLTFCICGLLLNGADSGNFGLYYLANGGTWFGLAEWITLLGCSALVILGLFALGALIALWRKPWSAHRVGWLGVVSAFPVVAQALGYAVIIAAQLL